MDEIFQKIIRTLLNALSSVKDAFVNLGQVQNSSNIQTSGKAVEDNKNHKHPTENYIHEDNKSNIVSDNSNLQIQRVTNLIDNDGNTDIIISNLTTSEPDEIISGNDIEIDVEESELDKDNQILNDINEESVTSEVEEEDTEVNIREIIEIGNQKEGIELFDEKFLDSLVDNNGKSEETVIERDKKIINKGRTPVREKKRRKRQSTKKRFRKKQPSKYKPTIRTPSSTRRSRNNNPYQINTADSRLRTLRMHLHISFGRRKQCKASLLPERICDLDIDVEVEGPDGNLSTWFASQDEWYSDVEPGNLGELLFNGADWKLISDTSQLNWVLSAREIYVLASSSAGTISGYVPVSRLILFERHVVLCTKRQDETVQQALSNAGCSQFGKLDESKGAPQGWVIFYDVKPSISITHDESVGLLNILRPVDNVEIILHGGIRISHSTWLKTHPPAIYIRGADIQEKEVMIDNEKAICDHSGKFTTDTWNTLGQHTIFCRGVSQSYELVEVTNEWEYFDAYSYNLKRSKNVSVDVCGPAILLNSENDFISLVPYDNSCLIGAVPGQITISPRSNKLQNDEYLAVAEFPIVWALPLNPLTCNKTNSTLKLINYEHVVKEVDISTRKIARDVVLWSQAILNSSRRHLRIEPDADRSLQLWKDYKKIARKYWRLLR